MLLQLSFPAYAARKFSASMCEGGWEMGAFDGSAKSGSCRRGLAAAGTVKCGNEWPDSPREVANLDGNGGGVWRYEWVRANEVICYILDVALGSTNRLLKSISTIQARCCNSSAISILFAQSSWKTEKKTVVI